MKPQVKPQRIAVVTGGAGFIGSHATDLLLEKGYRVRVVDDLSSGHLKNLDHLRNNHELTVDIRDLNEIEPDDSLFAGAEVVIHFAGIGDIVPSIEQPARYMQANVMGTVHALECSRHHRVKKFVYAASSSCYGIAEQVPTREDSPISPMYPYALSKFQGEQAVFHWNRVYGLPVNAIRIFNAYGPRSRTTGAYGAVFGVFLKQLLAKKPLTVVGDGSQTRDFVFVTDVARAFLAAAETSHSGEIYNLGAGNPQSVNRLVELLGSERVSLPKRPGEPDTTWADITKIRAHLGWEPLVSFENGVKIMKDRIEDWKDAPLWEPTSIAKATQVWFDSLSKPDGVKK